MKRVAVSKYGFQLFSPQEVAGLMQQSGFRDLRIDHSDQKKLYDSVIVVGIR
jgi:hypothetical protein